MSAASRDENAQFPKRRAVSTAVALNELGVGEIFSDASRARGTAEKVKRSTLNNNLRETAMTDFDRDPRAPGNKNRLQAGRWAPTTWIIAAVAVVLLLFVIARNSGPSSEMIEHRAAAPDTTTGAAPIAPTTPLAQPAAPMTTPAAPEANPKP
jgi:hypothetical protein